MFDLDIALFKFIYRNCRHLGGIFGFGAFEGFVMYSSSILLAIVKAYEVKKVKR